MDIFKITERSFAMDDEVWAHHANPWSVWTRYTTLPLIIIAIWSRVWLGWWFILPLAAALLWTWYNPRIFPKPDTTNNWASKATFGERVWLNRDKVAIPQHHKVVPHVLTIVSIIGMVFVIWGVAVLAIWPTLFGTALVYLGKLWFCDRMVWLYEDMKDADPQYQSWLY
ncbi:DUF6653 family protein [Fischerella sp. PCC 9605]|uniref:DUF6653 family protein n=1 Tax=Fischerella sp. PCC 9605 TaxID=1173024 RepID=UPI00047B4BB2|nr:DUF6653 family protein [Fischerella sp. PCC 9605]